MSAPNWSSPKPTRIRRTRRAANVRAFGRARSVRATKPPAWLSAAQSMADALARHGRSAPSVGGRARGRAHACAPSQRELRPTLVFISPGSPHSSRHNVLSLSRSRPSCTDQPDTWTCEARGAEAPGQRTAASRLLRRVRHPVAELALLEPFQPLVELVPPREAGRALAQQADADPAPSSARC